MKSLISINQLKGSTVINNNVDEMYLMEAIETAQDIKLCQLIGSKFLNELLDSVDDNGDWTGSETNYDFLIHYVQPYLKKQVISDVIIPLNYKIRNEGLLKVQPDHTFVPKNNDSLDEAIYIKEHYEAEANFYATRMTNFLCENISMFPSYRNSNDGDIKANPNAKNTVIYLG